LDFDLCILPFIVLAYALKHDCRVPFFLSGTAGFRRKLALHFPPDFSGLSFVHVSFPPLIVRPSNLTCSGDESIFSSFS